MAQRTQPDALLADQAARPRRSARRRPRPDAPDPASRAGVFSVLHEIVAQVGHHAADGVGDAGTGRDQHPRNAQLARQGGGVQRAGAAEGEEREVARIGAQRDRDHADRTRHLECWRPGSPPPPPGSHRGPAARPEPVRRPCAHGRRTPAPRRRRTPPGQAARGSGWRPRSSARCRRGHSRSGRDRRRRCPGRPRSSPAGVDPRDRPAAGTDGAHVDHRHVDRHGVFDLDLVGHRRLGRRGSAPHRSRCRPCHR